MLGAYYFNLKNSPTGLYWTQNMSYKSLFTKYGYQFMSLFVIVAAFITLIGNWVGGTHGSEVYVKASKDFVLYATLGGMLGYTWATKQGELVALLRKPYNLLIAVYALVHAAYLLLFDINPIAELAGLNFNLRFLALFVLVQLWWVLFPSDKQREFMKKVLIALGALLSVIAVLQVFVLPKDFLAFFGYELADTGLSYYTIDNDPTTLRANATTRGPNELGAFLLIPITLLVTKLWRKTYENRWRTLALLALMVFALGLTFSRSAFLGTGLSVVLLSAFYLKRHSHLLTRKRVFVAIVSVLAVLGALGALVMYSPRAQQVVFHAPLEEVGARGSDFQRLSQQAQAASWVTEEPEGYGLGTAGPSSFYNTTGTNITENYYLQIAIEVGVVGLIIFLAILFFVIRALVRSENPDRYALLASLAGLSFISLLLHGWADDLTGYAWWGLAGLLVAENNQINVLD